MTSKIMSQACSARKPIACPAVLKRKLTIEPISLGKSDPTFEPMSLRPFPLPLPVAFKALVIVPTTAPIGMPAERKMAVTVTPYFLQPPKLLVSFCYSSLCSFSFRRRGVFIILDDYLVFFILALELAFQIF